MLTSEYDIVTLQLCVYLSPLLGAFQGATILLIFLRDTEISHKVTDTSLVGPSGKLQRGFCFDRLPATYSLWNYIRLLFLSVNVSRLETTLLSSCYHSIFTKVSQWLSVRF